MVVVSHNTSALNHLLPIKPCKTTTTTPTTIFTATPEVDLSHPEAKTVMVKACRDYGFFKIINHGVPFDLIADLENHALNFFNHPHSSVKHMHMAAPPHDPFGYGSNRIGSNGDVGCVEYLLLNTNPHLISPNSLLILHQIPMLFRCVLEEYIGEMKKMCCEVLEVMAEGLGIVEKNALSKVVGGEKNDSCFRLNHYPAATTTEAAEEKMLVGFGEHTDPQIISVLRSNNTSGLQICLNDGTWVSIPPDPSSFFINVGDSLQVMTNGRFKSVKHRVLAESKKTRVSMIYFGGAALSEKITPLKSLVSKDEESLYKEFTWLEYKNAAYKSRLADNRLSLFEK
ncbi:Gibberellin 2-beta-dioxygenase [Stylosanthes scabra]|uniref:Gibberellin 2-beta-dioxygenase n=1 Tax=Stylosanthes scabra TaxID=79078 RepID=A0ABU6X4V0_9FABA|nr:Gibberellin 2-beta-dioxygenase [Stylosanthes scabra]